MRIRYSVRTSLIVITHGVRGNRQHRAVLAIQSTASVVLYDYQYDQDQGFITGLAPELPVTLLSEIAGPYAFRRVTYLSLGARFSDNDAPHLAELHSLEELDLSDLSVTDPSLNYVGKLGRLKKLRLANTQTTDEGLGHLANCSQLRRLDLSATDVTDDGLVVLRNFKDLDTLILQSTGITSAGLKHISHCRRLRELWLNDTQISDEGIRRLLNLPALQSLSLRGTKVTPSGINQLGNLKVEQLEYDWQLYDIAILKYFFCELQGRSLREALVASGLGDSGRVYLRNMNVQDDDVAQLANLGPVRSLFLDGNPITDRSIPHLAMLTKLRRLSLEGTQITNQGVELLRQRLPKCHIQ